MPYPRKCPYCGSRDIHETGNYHAPPNESNYICEYCDESWCQ